VLSGTSDEQHLLENVRALERPALPREVRERVVELFRHVDDVSGH
jgi:aryl-alcohol dehydrogenase-like predicted oxidoreductase